MKLTKEDIFRFKEEAVISGIRVDLYRFIGCGIIIDHNLDEETVIVTDETLITDSKDDEFFRSYSEAEFFEVYGGYHMGTDDVSIEDLIIAEWASIINSERSDFATTASQLKSFDKAVTAKDFNLNLIN